MRPLKSVLIHSVGWHLSELLDLIPTPIDHSGSVTGKVPERVTEKEKKISELLVEAPEAINAELADHRLIRDAFHHVFEAAADFLI